MENKNKKKRSWSELSRDIFIPLIPPAVVASIVAPIAIVYGNNAPVTEEEKTFINEVNNYLTKSTNTISCHKVLKYWKVLVLI